MTRIFMSALALNTLVVAVAGAQARARGDDGTCPMEARTAHEAGLAALADENAARARVELADAIARCPSVASYHVAFGRAIILLARDAPMLRKPGLARRARAEWELALQLDSTNVAARANLVTWFLSAPRVMGGSAHRAMELAEEIRLLDPVRGAIAAARVHRHAKRYDDARRELRVALASDPSSEDAAALLAQLDGPP